MRVTVVVGVEGVELCLGERDGAHSAAVHEAAARAGRSDRIGTAAAGDRLVALDTGLALGLLLCLLVRRVLLVAVIAGGFLLAALGARLAGVARLALGNRFAGIV